MDRPSQLRNLWRGDQRPHRIAYFDHRARAERSDRCARYKHNCRGSARAAGIRGVANLGKKPASRLFAALLDAYRNSFRSICRKLMNGSSASGGDRERTRQAARLARSNLETSLERFAAEPRATAAQLAQANGMLASSHRFAHAMIALEAGIPEMPAEAPRLQFEAYGKAVEKTL